MRSQTVAQLATALIKREIQHPLRVAVDGRTASGKTTLADELAREIERHDRTALRTSIDGFHRSKSERYRQGRNSAKGYYEDARNLADIRRLLLDPLGPTGNLTYRTASFDIERDIPVDQPPTIASPTDILIIDGTFLQRPELIDAWDYVVFVAVPEELAAERGARRDTNKLGGYAKALLMHQNRYQTAFALYAAECMPTSGANAIFDNRDFAKPVLTFAG